jgi:hypothetical protein
MSSRRRKNAKPANGVKGSKPSENGKEELGKAQIQENSKLHLKQTPPNALNASSPP